MVGHFVHRSGETGTEAEAGNSVVSGRSNHEYSEVDEGDDETEDDRNCNNIIFPDSCVSLAHWHRASVCSRVSACSTKLHTKQR